MATIVRELMDESLRRLLVHEYVQKETDRAGFGGLTIQRLPLGTHLKIIAERPGIVIGRRGADIQRLTDELERKFDYESLQIEASEVPNYALNPMIMASKVAYALERGWNYRRAGNSMLQRVMDSNARGCQITIAGKLTGLRHRTEKFISGHIKHCGEPALQCIEVGYAQAKLKPGTIGIKVEIMPPDARLPDEINVVEPETPPPAPGTLEAEVPSVDDGADDKPPRKGKAKKTPPAPAEPPAETPTDGGAASDGAGDETATPTETADTEGEA